MWLLKNIDLFISQLASVCLSHIGLQALNQSDIHLWHSLPPPIRTLSVCRGWLAGTVLQGVGSWGLRQPRGPGGGGVGVISMLSGPVELSGFCLIYVRDAFLELGSKAAEGVRRERCGERLLWCCRHCEGMLAYRSAHCVEHHAVSFLQCGTASIWVHNTVNWLRPVMS